MTTTQGLFLLSFFFLLLISCQSDKQMDKVRAYFTYPATELKYENAGIQMIPIETPVGKFKVWTKRFGNHPTVKILLLHGGPAMTHEYMECFETFFGKEGFEFYEYDQLGSYYSDQPKDTSLWHLDRFVEEVEQVRKALKLEKDNFYLLGNSWGGILGMQYALKYQQHLKGLIVCNMQASFARYAQYNAKLRSQMPTSFMDSIYAFEKANKYTDSTYNYMVLTKYYTKHLCRIPLDKWPDGLNRSFKHVNSPIYVMMQGPSEFKAGGNLVGWDIMDRLKEISVPTLMVGAKYDTMDPEDMKKQSELVQKGKFLYCPNGSHLSMWDDQEVFMKGIIDFVHEVDEKK
ncbi:MAG: proline iminopeptidase-family hydrolase [Bacteroidia bacterium]